MKDRSRVEAIRRVMRIKSVDRKQATVLVDQALRGIEKKLIQAKNG